MKAYDFLMELTNFCRAAPGNGDAEVMIGMEPPICYMFGKAMLTRGIDQQFLILTGIKDTGVEVRDVTIQ